MGEYNPESVVENEMIKILCDINTDRIIQARRLDPTEVKDRPDCERRYVNGL